MDYNFDFQKHIKTIKLDINDDIQFELTYE
jgi:hypothetical protein